MWTTATKEEFQNILFSTEKVVSESVKISKFKHETTLSVGGIKLMKRVISSTGTIFLKYAL